MPSHPSPPTRLVRFAVRSSVLGLAALVSAATLHPAVRPIVLAGDSVLGSWKQIVTYFPGTKFVNAGLDGDTTQGLLDRIQHDVLSHHPAGIILLIGGNDLDHHVPPATIAANVRRIVQACERAEAASPIIVCELLPGAASDPHSEDLIRQSNLLMLKAVADEPQATVLDTCALFAGPNGAAKPEEMPDGIHPNMLGSAKWANALRPYLERLNLVPAWPDDFTPEDGFESLFNGRDLAGWHYAAGPDLSGRRETSDRRYVVGNQRLIDVPAPVGHGTLKLWTVREFPGDFVLKLEFRASPNADSGIFVREPQLQCRDFVIAGPFSALKHYRALDWNEIVVTVKSGLAHCTCNGEILLDAMPVPPSGPIGLESDHGQVEYRRIRIKSLALPAAN